LFWLIVRLLACSRLAVSGAARRVPLHSTRLYQQFALPARIFAEN
jgi:hypothetical protein